MCYEQGLGGLAQDYQHAIKLYEMSADLGLDLAMTNIAYLFYKLATDNVTPFKYNEEVNDQSELYFKAATWARRALFTNERNSEALFLMGKLYEEGYSVD